MSAPETLGTTSARLPFVLPKYLADLNLRTVTIPEGETPEDRAERLALQDAGRRRAWTSRLPKRYEAATLDALHPQQDPDGRVSGWLTTDSLTLFLAGPPSRGKTFAAYAVGREAVETHGRWTLAWTVADLNAAMRPNGDETAFDHAAACDLLLLDDIGREQVTAWSLEMMQRLLDARNRERRRQIITTNLTYDDLLERYGDPIVQRLLADSSVVKIVGDGLRQPSPW